MNSAPTPVIADENNGFERAKLPLVTVIVPVLNEVDFIARTLDSLLLQDYPKQQLEILLIDGDSSDGSIDILHRYQNQHACIKVLNNPQQTAPFALNTGISNARGSVVMRMDCHSEYPPHYISRLIEHQQALQADNIGGLCIAIPADNTPTSGAIAIALSSRLGVGGSDFRVGSNSIKLVDTVPFGCYRREVFDRIGLFDTELTRNQDDEFNSRLIKNGGSIYLVPDVEIKYFTRNTLRKLSRMFFQYGLFKPLANVKSGRLSSIRQLIPALFVLAVVVLFMLAPVLLDAQRALVVVLATYVACIALTSVKQAADISRPSVFPMLMLTYPTLHLSYGCGYWLGLFKLLVHRQTPTISGTSR